MKDKEMSQWKILKRKQIRREIIYLILTAISIMSGVIGELLVKHGIALMIIEYFDSISLAAIQIQASIVTLSISIIAIISGQMDKTYRGISYNKFWSEIKPNILRQGFVILASILTIPINIILHMHKFYNIVFAVVIASVLLIIASIEYIYKIFLGTKDVKCEINYYLEYSFSYFDSDDKNQIEHLKYLYGNFVEDWKSNIGKQSISDFNSDKDFFIDCGRCLLSSKNNGLLEEYKKSCITMIEICFEAENKHRGIVLIQDIYDDIWNYILNSKSVVSEFSVSFDLFNEVSYELWNVTKELPTDIIEKYIQFESFSENVLRTECWINPQEENIKNTSKQLNDYIRLTAYNVLKRGDADAEKWGHMLTSLFISGYNIPEQFQSIFKKSKASLYLHYSIGIILAGRHDIVKEYLYAETYELSYTLEDETLRLAYALQCYIYYLAEWETELCISNELINQSKEFLSDNEIKCAFGKVAKQIAYTGMLNKELYDSTYELLRNLEFYPKKHRAKRLLMEDAVRVFSYYMLLFYARYDYRHNILGEISQISPLIYASDLIMSEKRNHFKRIRAFVGYNKIFQSDKIIDKDNIIQSEATNLMNTFQKQVSTDIKNQATKEAVDAQERFEQSDAERKEAILSAEIKKFLESQFAPLFRSTTSSARSYESLVFSLSLPTKMLESEETKNWTSHLQANYVDYLGQLMYSVHMLDKYKKNDDSDFLNMLTTKNITHLMGGRHLYSPKQYSNYIEKYNSFEKSCNTDFLEYGSSLFAFDISKFKCGLQNVRTVIRNMKLEELNVSYDSNSVCHYEINNCEVEFAKDEFAQFVKNQYKVVEVYVTTTLDVTEEPIGVIIDANFD